MLPHLEQLGSLARYFAPFFCVYMTESTVTVIHTKKETGWNKNKKSGGCRQAHTSKMTHPRSEICKTGHAHNYSTSFLAVLPVISIISGVDGGRKKTLGVLTSETP